jgi:4-amino-4-deoxy-L-arabinose transferase-like glycosyltransferase
MLIMSVESPPVTDIKPPRCLISWQHVILLAILLLAAILRFWRLDSWPPGLHHDEAYNGLDALSLLNRETFPIFYEGWELYAQDIHQNRPIYQTTFPPFFEGNYGREPLTIYLSTGAIALFGPTPFAVRFVPALAGILAVLATYLAAKILSKSPGQATDEGNFSQQEAFSNLTPLVAAFAMAILYPAITYSRYGDRVMVFVPIAAFTVYCFWRGIEAAEARRISELESGIAPPIPLGDFAPKWFFIGGLFLGLGLYAYAAARFMPLLFLAFVFLWYVRDRVTLRRQWANLTLMALTSVIVAFPLILFMIRHPYFLIFRSRVIANRGLGTFPGRPWITWLLNIGRVIRGLIWEGDSNLLHNLPGRPYLDPIQFVLASAGIVRIILRRFERREVFLLLWLLVMLLPGILSGDAPHFGRLIGAAAPLAILVAMGAVWLGQLLINRFAPENMRTTQFLAIGLTILMLVSASIAVFDYVRYANLSELPVIFDYSDWQLGQYATSLPDDATIYLTPNQEKMATIYFAMEGQRNRLRSFHSPGESLIPAGHQGQPAYFLVRTHANSVLGRLEEQFPQGVLEANTPSFISYWLPESSSRSLNDAPSEISWSGAIALDDWWVELSGETLYVTLVWETQVAMTRDYTVYVHLLDSDGSLVSQLDRPPDGYPTSDWTPGEIIQDQYQIALPPDIRPGTYRIQSGFYHLPTQERLGEPRILGEVEIP